jgi:hypothetical protein
MTLTKKDITNIYKPSWTQQNVTETFEFLTGMLHPTFAPNQFRVRHKVTGVQGHLTLQQGIYHSFDPENS